MVRSQEGDSLPNHFAAHWGAPGSEDMASAEATTTQVPPESPSRTHLEVVVDSQVFHIERKLLINHSPFLRHILQKKENKSKSKLKLSGVSATTLHILLDYMRTGELAVTPGNVTEIFNAAFRLHMADVVKRCIQMETEAAPLGQIILMYTAARKLKLPEEESRVFCHLAANFMSVATEKEFLEMDVEDIMPLMSAEMIGCHCEPEVFEAGMRWLNHAPTRRYKYGDKVMDCVRFSSMDLTQLQQCLEYPGVTEMNQVREKITDAVSRIAKKSDVSDDQSEAKALQQCPHLSEQCDVSVIAIGELRSRSPSAVPVNKMSIPNTTSGRSFLNRGSYDFVTNEDAKESDRPGDSSKIVLDDSERGDKDGFADPASQMGGASPWTGTRNSFSSSQFLQSCQPRSTDSNKFSTRKSERTSGSLLEEARERPMAESRTMEVRDAFREERKSRASEDEINPSTSEESKERTMMHVTQPFTTVAPFPVQQSGNEKMLTASDLSTYCTLGKVPLAVKPSVRRSTCDAGSLTASAAADRPSAVFVGELSGVSERTESSVFELRKIPSIFSVSTYSFAQEQEGNPQTTWRKSTSSSGLRKEEGISGLKNGGASPGPDRSFSPPFSVESTDSTDKSGGSHNKSSAEKKQLESSGSSEKYGSAMQPPSTGEKTMDDTTFATAGEVLRSTLTDSSELVHTLIEESPCAKARPTQPNAKPETEETSEVTASVATDAQPERQLSKHADEWRPDRAHPGGKFPADITLGGFSTMPVLPRITSLHRLFVAKELHPRPIEHVRLPASGGIQLGIAVHFVMVRDKDKNHATEEAGQGHEHNTTRETPGAQNATAEASVEGSQPTAQDSTSGVTSIGEAHGLLQRDSAEVAISERDSGNDENLVTQHTAQPTTAVALDPRPEASQEQDALLRDGETKERDDAKDFPIEKPDGTPEQEERAEAAAHENESYLPYLEVESPVTGSESESRNGEMAFAPVAPHLGEISEKAVTLSSEENINELEHDEAAMHGRAASEIAENKVQKSPQEEGVALGPTSEDHPKPPAAESREHIERTKPEPDMTLVEDRDAHTGVKILGYAAIAAVETHPQLLQVVPEVTSTASLDGPTGGDILSSSKESHHDETHSRDAAPGASQPACSQPPSEEHIADVMARKATTEETPPADVQVTSSEGVPQEHTATRTTPLLVPETVPEEHASSADKVYPFISMVSHTPVMICAPVVTARPEDNDQRERDVTKKVPEDEHEVSAFDHRGGQTSDPGAPLSPKATSEALADVNGAATDMYPEAYLLRGSPLSEEIAPATNGTLSPPLSSGKPDDDAENKGSVEVSTPEPYLPYLEVESPVTDSEAASPNGSEKLSDEVHEDEGSLQVTSLKPVSQLPYLEVESPATDSEAVSPSGGERSHDEVHEDKGSTLEPVSHLPYLEVESPVTDSEAASPSGREKSHDEVHEDKGSPEERKGSSLEPVSHLPYLEVESPVTESEAASPSGREKLPDEIHQGPAAIYNQEVGTEAIGKEMVDQSVSDMPGATSPDTQGESGGVLEEITKPVPYEIESEHRLEKAPSPTKVQAEEEVPEQEPPAVPKAETMSASSLSAPSTATGAETSPAMQKTTSLAPTHAKAEEDKPHDRDVGKSLRGRDDQYVLQKTQISATAPMHSVHVVEENVFPGTQEDTKGYSGKLTKPQKTTPRTRPPIPEAETGGSSADESSDADIPSLENRQVKRKRTRSSHKTLSRSPVFLRTRIAVKGPSQSVELVSEKSPVALKDATATGANIQPVPTAGETREVIYDGGVRGLHEQSLGKDLSREEGALDDKMTPKDSVNIERVMKKLSEVTEQKKLMEDAYSREGGEKKLEAMQQDIQRLGEHEESLKEVLRALAQAGDPFRTTEAVKAENTPSQLSVSSSKPQNLSLTNTQENMRMKLPAACVNEAVKHDKSDVSASGLHPSEQSNNLSTNGRSVHGTRAEHSVPVGNETQIVKNLSANSMGGATPPSMPSERLTTSCSEMSAKPPLKLVKKKIQLDTVRTTVTEQQQNVKTLTDQRTGVEQKTSRSETTTKGEVHNTLTEEIVETYDTPVIVPTLPTHVVATVSGGMSPETCTEPETPEKSPDCAPSPPTSPLNCSAYSGRKKKKRPVAIRVMDDYDSDDGKEAVDTLPKNSVEPRSILKPPHRADESETAEPVPEEHPVSEEPSWEVEIQQEERIRMYPSPDEFFANFVSQGQQAPQSEAEQDKSNGPSDGKQEEQGGTGAVQQPSVERPAAIPPCTQDNALRADDGRTEKSLQKIEVTREAEVVQLAIITDSYGGNKNHGSRSVRAVAEGSFDTYASKSVRNEESHVSKPKLRLSTEQLSAEQEVRRSKASDRVRSFQTLSELSISGHLVVHKRKKPSKTDAPTETQGANCLKEAIIAVPEGTASLSSSKKQLKSTEEDFIFGQNRSLETVTQPCMNTEPYQILVDSAQALDDQTSAELLTETVEEQHTCASPRTSRTKNVHEEYYEPQFFVQPRPETCPVQAAQAPSCVIPQKGQELGRTEVSEELSGDEKGPSLLDVMSSVYIEAMNTVRTLPFFEAKWRDNFGRVANAPVPVPSETTAPSNDSPAPEPKKEQQSGGSDSAGFRPAHGSGREAVRAEEKEGAGPTGAPPEGGTRKGTPLVLHRIMISEVESIGEVLSLIASECGIWNNDAKKREDSDTHTDFLRQPKPATGELDKATEDPNLVLGPAPQEAQIHEKRDSVVTSHRIEHRIVTSPPDKFRRVGAPTSVAGGHHDLNVTKSDEDVVDPGKPSPQGRVQISRAAGGISNLNSQNMDGTNDVDTPHHVLSSDLLEEVAEKREEGSSSQFLDTTGIIGPEPLGRSDTLEEAKVLNNRTVFGNESCTESPEEKDTHVDAEAVSAAGFRTQERNADEPRGADAGASSTAQVSLHAVNTKKAKIDKVSLADVFKVQVETIAQQSKNPQWVFFETEVVTGTEQADDGRGPSELRQRNKQMGEQGAPGGIEKLTGPSTSRRPVEVVARGGVVPWAKKKASVERSKQKVVAQSTDVVSSSEPPSRGQTRPQCSLAPAPSESVTSDATKAKTSKEGQVEQIAAEIPPRAGSEPMFKTLKDLCINGSTVFSPRGTAENLGSPATSFTKPLPTDTVCLVASIPVEKQGMPQSAKEASASNVDCNFLPVFGSLWSSSTGTTSKELIHGGPVNAGSQAIAKEADRSSTDSLSHFCETIKRLPDSSRSMTPTETNAEAPRDKCHEQTSRAEKRCRPESVRNIIRRIRKKNHTQVAPKEATKDHKQLQEGEQYAPSVGNQGEVKNPAAGPRRGGSEVATTTATTDPRLQQTKLPSTALPHARGRSSGAAGGSQVWPHQGPEGEDLARGLPKREKITNSLEASAHITGPAISPRRNVLKGTEERGEHSGTAGASTRGAYDTDTVPQTGEDAKQGPQEPDASGSDQALKATDSKQFTPDEGVTREEFERYMKIVKELKYRRGSSVPPSGTLQSNENVPGQQKKPVVVMDARVQLFGKGRVSLSFDATAENSARDDSQTMVRRFSSTLQTPKGSSTELRPGFIPPPPSRQPSMDASKRKSVDFGLLNSANTTQPDPPKPRGWVDDSTAKRRYSEHSGQPTDDLKQRACGAPRAFSSTSEGRTNLFNDKRLEKSLRTKKSLRAALNEAPCLPGKHEYQTDLPAISTKNTDVGSRSRSRKSTKDTDVTGTALRVSSQSERPASAPPTVNREHRRRPSSGFSENSPSCNETLKPLTDDSGYRTCDSRLRPVAEKSSELIGHDDASRVKSPQPVPAPRMKPTAPPATQTPPTNPTLYGESGTANTDISLPDKHVGPPKPSQLAPSKLEPKYSQDRLPAGKKYRAESTPQTPTFGSSTPAQEKLDSASRSSRTKISLPVKQTKAENVHESKTTGHLHAVVPTRFHLVVHENEPEREGSKQSVLQENDAKSRGSKCGATNVHRVTPNTRTNAEEVVAFQADPHRKLALRKAPGTQDGIAVQPLASSSSKTGSVATEPSAPTWAIAPQSPSLPHTHPTIEKETQQHPVQIAVSVQLALSHPEQKALTDTAFAEAAPESFILKNSTEQTQRAQSDYSEAERPAEGRQADGVEQRPVYGVKPVLEEPTSQQGLRSNEPEEIVIDGGSASQAETRDLTSTDMYRQRDSDKSTTKPIEWLELDSSYDSPCIVTIAEIFDKLSGTYIKTASRSQNSRAKQGATPPEERITQPGQLPPRLKAMMHSETGQIAKGQNQFEQVSREFLCSEPALLEIDAQTAYLEAATRGQVTSQKVDIARRPALLAVPIEKLFEEESPGKAAVTKKRIQALQEELLIAKLLVKRASSRVAPPPNSQAGTEPKGAAETQPSDTAEESVVRSEKVPSVHLVASKAEEKKALPRGCFSKGSVACAARAANSISLEKQREAARSGPVEDENALQSSWARLAKSKDDDRGTAQGHPAKRYLPIKAQSETETRFPGAEKLQRKTGQQQAALGDVFVYPVGDEQKNGPRSADKTEETAEGREDIVPRDSLPPAPADVSKHTTPREDHHPPSPAPATSGQLQGKAKDGTLTEPADVAAKERALEDAGSAHPVVQQHAGTGVPAAAHDQQLQPDLADKDSVKEDKGRDAGGVLEYHAGEVTQKVPTDGGVETAASRSKTRLAEKAAEEKDARNLMSVEAVAPVEGKMLPMEARGLADRQGGEMVEKEDDHVKTAPTYRAEQPLVEEAAQEKKACVPQQKEPPIEQEVRTPDSEPAFPNILNADDTSVPPDQQMLVFEPHDIVSAPEEQLVELRTESPGTVEAASPQTGVSPSKDHYGDLLHVGGIFISPSTSGESPHLKPSTRTTDVQTEFSAPPSVSSTELFVRRDVREASTSAALPEDTEGRKAPDDLPPYLERVTLSAKPSIADMIRKLTPCTEEWEDTVPMDWKLNPAKDIEKWSSPCVQDARSPTLLLLGGINISALGQVLTGCLVLRYNLEDNQWKRCSMMPLPRYGHRCVYVNGEIYVIGGFDNRDATYGLRMSTNFCFRYNIRTGEWNVTAPLQHARGYHGVAVLNNYIYTVGGVDTSDLLLSSVERYDHEQDTWSVLDKGLYCGRMGMGVAAFRNNLWVVGGVVQIAGLQTCSTAYVEIYNPTTNQWTYAANHLPSPRTCVSLLTLGDNALYCFGGIFYNCVGTDRKLVTIDDIIAYAADDKGWKQVSSMPAPRHNAHVLQCGGQQFVVGGQDIDRSDQPVTSILAMEISGDNIDWKPLKDVPLPISAYGAVVVPPLEEAQAPPKQPVHSDT